MQTKWITSMESFAPIVMPVLEMVQPKHICEIGAAEGGHTRLLYQFSKQHHARLTTVDPFPRGSFLSWVKESSDTVTHIADFSFNAIPKTSEVDAWFIDGDHNWYTVFNELRLVDGLAQQDHKPALIFLHDVGWPCGRRDMYYDPQRIPAEFLQPHSAELGIVMHKQESIKGGFRGPHWALKEGGPRNGVLTAIEDFIKITNARYDWMCVPAVLGLGVLVDRQHRCREQIIQHFAPYHNNPVMALLEQDRITHYLAVIELNDKLAKINAALQETI